MYTTTSGFEKDLTEKQKFYLYLFEKCPIPYIIDDLWKQYTIDKHKKTLSYYQSISPYRGHPCGNDSISLPIGGFIDPDMFYEYYIPRQNYLLSIKFIGDPWFICQFYRTKEVLESYSNYYDVLINEQAKKISRSKKKRVLDKVIDKLSYDLDINQIYEYLLCHYNTYKNKSILHGYPLAVDCDGELCKFE